MKINQKVYVAALGYSIIIGFSFMFVKIALESATPMDTLAHRFTASFLVASLFLFSSKARFRIQVKDFLLILPLALLYPTLFFTFQAYGLVYTTSSEAGIIFATIPILTMILSALFLKERSAGWQIFFICLSVSGVLYISVMNGVNVHSSSSMTGTILILLSALSSAAYSVLARKLTQKYSLFPLTYIMAGIGFIAFNTMAIVQHVIKGTLSGFFTPLSNGGFLFSILYLGILSTLCTSFLTNYALSKMEAFKVSVFNNLATLITLFAGVLLLQEAMHYYHVIGTIVILVGVIGTNLTGKRIKKTLDTNAVQGKETISQNSVGG
ncbi:DMT family transporter [Caldalkalibacillus mannanilyticus]|uniref:DMT family transporter n=1 Tax=Caldalkalibacillus mannanilyticus TaxID=1418 RepID=UPI00046A26D3|nr:DMT family transporter [Caldalkalibacillus mannanilyticus]